jgi:multidrug efflux pump subunit AcrB
MLVQIAPPFDPRNPVRFFDRITHRPGLTIAGVLAIAAIGARALTGLESSVDLGLGRPTIGITVRYSGALPRDVEREVVRPIERRVSGVRGVVRTEATAQEGTGRVVLYFDFPRQLESASLAVQDAVDATRRDLPPGTEAPVVGRMNALAGALVVDGDSLASTGLLIVECAVLACLILLCVGRSWRSALIVLFSVVLSTIGTFELMALSGVRLTAVTLVGVALAMMFFFDDGITVRESIGRQVELGLDARRAASTGVAGVVRTLAFGSLATHAVFGFIAMVGGDSGRWFGGIGMVVMGAAGASLFVSATLVPAASALVAPTVEGGRVGATSSRLDAWLERIAEGHHDLLAWSISRRRAIAVSAIGVACIVVMILASVVRTDTTSRSIELDVRGPDAQTLSGVAQRVAEELRRVDGVTEPIVSPAAHDAGEGLARIDHVDGDRVDRVRTSVRRHRVSDVLSDVDARIAATPLPPGYTVRHSGDVADRVRTVGRLARASAVALALLALMIAIRFRSLIAAFSILVGVPVAWLGASLALRLTDTPAGVLPLISGGFLTLMAVRHGMQLLVAYEDRRAHGLNTRVSLVEAGRARLRPTVMSLCALVAALLPLGFAGGALGAAQRSLVIALVGGLIASAIATLYVVPAMLALLEDAALVLGARLRSRLARGKRGVGVLPGANDHGVVRS